MNDADGLASMSLPLCNRPPHSSVKGFDSRIKYPASRIEMARTKGVWITGEPRPGKVQTIRGSCTTKTGRNLVRLNRFVVTVLTHRPIERSSCRGRARVGP